MAKAFYISIPYSTAGMEVKKSFVGNIVSGFSKKTARQTADRFEENKVQLQQRADIVSQGLARWSESGAAEHRGTDRIILRTV